MAAYTYLVTVELERDSGLWASRDDVSETLQDAVREGIESASLSGLGPNGDSEYSVSDVSVEELDAKAERQAKLDYDAHVLADIPAETKTQSALKARNVELAAMTRRAGAAEKALLARQAEQEQHRTRVYQEDSIDRESRFYLRDGRYDRIAFQYGARNDDRYIVALSDEGNLVIRCESFAGQMAVVPRSSNELEVAVVGRDALKSARA